MGNHENMGNQTDTGDFQRRALPPTENGEQPIEVRRYLSALRRSLPLIAGIVIVFTATIYLVSSSRTKRYEARATIVRQNLTVIGQTQNVDSLTRDLNTINTLLNTRRVLAAAARNVPGETTTSLAERVHSRVDPSANLIYVTATDFDPVRAATVASAVAKTFVAQQIEGERSQALHARAALQLQLDRVRGRPGSEAQVQAIEQRISELAVGIATAGTDLAVADSAAVPTSPVTPHPVRDAGLGVLLGLFVGVLIALARDQVAPLASARELSRILDVPVLGSIPHTRRWGRRRGMSVPEREAYQTLATSLRFSLRPADGPHIILVTSALHHEGKSTVTAQLGSALARGGHRTLLISADLRRPTLHELVGAPIQPGLGDILLSLPRLSIAEARARVIAAIHHVEGRQGAELDILPSGRTVEPTSVLADANLDALFTAVAGLDYTYILVDTPALLGLADGQALARHCTALLYVARLTRTTPAKAVDARDVFERVNARPVGVVVIGGRPDASPHYFNGRPPTPGDA